MTDYCEWMGKSLRQQIEEMDFKNIGTYANLKELILYKIDKAIENLWKQRNDCYADLCMIEWDAIDKILGFGNDKP